MDQNPSSMSSDSQSSSKTAMWIVLSVVLTALIIGGGVYMMQASALSKTEKDFQAKIDTLQSKVAKLEVQNVPAVSEKIDSTTTTPETTTTQPGTQETKQAGNTYTNTVHNVTFTLPTGYTTGSQSFGITDSTKAGIFSIQKEAPNYSDTKNLIIRADLKLKTGQTVKQLAQSIYEINKSKNQTTTSFTETTIDGLPAYQFGLKNGYTSDEMGSGQQVAASGAKVIYFEQNSKVFEFLQTGADAGLDSVVKSTNFN